MCKDVSHLFKWHKGLKIDNPSIMAFFRGADHQQFIIMPKPIAQVLTALRYILSGIKITTTIKSFQIVLSNPHTIKHHDHFMVMFT